MGIDAAKFADLLAGYCLEVLPDQQILVRSSTLAQPLLLELQRAILDRGAWPIIHVELPGAARTFYEHAQDRQLDEPSDIAFYEARKAAAHLGIQAPDDTRALADVDPEVIQRAALGRAPLREITLKKRWCSTLWPTPALAESAGMTLEEYEDFVSRAMFLNQVQPVRSWGELRWFQERLIDRLKKVRKIKIESEGTDITLEVKGRTWVNSDGKRNMPSGEVFTGPQESSANGVITFDLPSSPSGVHVQGVRLVFKDGVVVEATAEEGEEYLRHALDVDDGARRLGEIGIGTNFGIDRPTGTILFDEKIGGTVHLALGRSYPETGGKNRSSLHWDLICDLRTGGRLWADDDLIQQHGRFIGFT